MYTVKKERIHVMNVNFSMIMGFNDYLGMGGGLGRRGEVFKDPGGRADSGMSKRKKRHWKAHRSLLQTCTPAEPQPKLGLLPMLNT